jgi:hypothetical protein
VRVGRRGDCLGQSNIGSCEIVAFAEQRFARGLRETVGEAIAAVELGRVSAALAEVAACGGCDFGLFIGYRYDFDFGVPDPLVGAAAEDGGAGSFDDNGRLLVVCGRHGGLIRIGNRLGESPGLGFTP